MLNLRFVRSHEGSPDADHTSRKTRETMTKGENEYVWLDGMLLKEEHLVKLAMNVGNYAQAEHYLFALLAHGVLYGKQEMVEKVNEVREFYGVPKIPMAGNEVSRDCSRQGESLDDKARTAFRKMTIEDRRKLLRSSLSLLRTNHHLFIYARHWLGVFLVIRDRLEGDSLKMKDFIDYANDIMPLDWPITLKMGLNTYKNFGREIDFNDKGEAYYDMENCPQKELCDTLWDIIKQMILTTV